MIDSFRAYLLSLIAASILASVIASCVPNGVVRKALLFACGAAVLLTAVRPLSALMTDALSQSVSLSAFAPSDQTIDLTQTNKALTQQYIKERCEAYILHKAEQKHVAVKSAFVTLSGEEIPVPVAVTITGEFTKGQRELMTEAIEDALGVAAENQTWIWE